MNTANKLLLIIVGLTVLIIVAVTIALTGGGSKESAPASSASNPSTSANEPSNTTKPTLSAGDDTSLSSESTVEIKDYAYSPKTLKIRLGDTVTWTNQDSVRHDVVTAENASEGPNSELLAKGENYSYTFKKAGTYDYYCSPHPYMKATVVVE